MTNVLLVLSVRGLFDMSEHVQNCHVDFLGFTIKPADMDGFDYMAAIVGIVKAIFGPVSIKDTGRGVFGYACRLDIEGVGLVAYGGNGGSIHFEITGDGCALVADWGQLADMLETSDAKITRCDIAHDDYEGDTLSMDWAREQYQTGGFKPSRGVTPNASFVSDEGSGKGCTYYVGSRESGKLARIYEKGKQLGDKFSKWCRFEVEWRAVHRQLPVEMLRDPSAYLVGSYKCAKFIGSRSSLVQTIAFKAAATLEKAADHAEKQAGSVIRAFLDLGHTAEQIIAKLVRPTMTPRLAVNVAALKAYREAEKPLRAPAWWKPVSKEDADRIAAMLNLDLSFWKRKWSAFQLSEVT